MKTTDPIRTLLARVKELDEKATGGPWAAEEGSSWDSDVGVLPQSGVHTGEGLPLTWDDHGGEVFKPEDADLIAVYRTLAPQLARALKAVLEVCEGWKARGEHDMDYSKQVPEGISDVLYENGAEMIEKARIIRNAITEHLGVGYE